MGAGRPNIYPYKSYFDKFQRGHRVVLYLYKDFECTPEQMAYNLRRYAKNHSISISVTVSPRSVEIKEKHERVRSKYANARDDLGLKYPWTKWLDGKQHRLIYGEDYQCTAETIRRLMHRVLDRSKPHFFSNRTTYIVLQGHLDASKVSRNRYQDSRK